MESAGVAKGLLHFAAKSSFGAAIFFVHHRCPSSTGAPIMRSAKALPLVICGLDLGAFAAAVAKGRDWGAGSSPGGVAPTGSSPICARCRCGRRRVGEWRPSIVTLPPCAPTRFSNGATDCRRSYAAMRARVVAINATRG